MINHLKKLPKMLKETLEDFGRIMNKPCCKHNELKRKITAFIEEQYADSLMTDEIIESVLLERALFNVFLNHLPYEQLKNGELKHESIRNQLKCEVLVLIKGVLDDILDDIHDTYQKMKLKTTCHDIEESACKCNCEGHAD